MAFTVSTQYTTVFGNKRVVGLIVTADATSGVINSGLEVIETVAFANKSMTSGASFRANELTAATASPGELHIVNCTSGDAMYVTCIGR